MIYSILKIQKTDKITLKNTFKLFDLPVDEK
jgi:hypothetical protein